MGIGPKTQGERRAGIEVPHRSPRDHERPQKEQGAGALDYKGLRDWLERQSRRRRSHLTLTEILVLLAIMNVADGSNGRCDAKINWLAKLANRSRRSVQRAISTLVELGIVEHVWFTPLKARVEFPKGSREARKGRCTNWLRVRTVEELLERVKGRKLERRTTERRATRGHSPRVDTNTPTHVHSLSGSLSLLSESLTNPAAASSHGVKAEAPAAPGESAVLAPLPEQSSTKTRGGPAREHTAARALPANDEPDIATRNVPDAPRSFERARAANGPLPLPPEVAAELERIAGRWLRLGLPGYGVRPLLANRWRLGVALEELEAAVYGAADDERMRRRAWCPAALVFGSGESIADFAHRGRPVRDTAEREARARLECAGRRAAETSKRAQDIAPPVGLSAALFELPVSGGAPVKPQRAMERAPTDKELRERAVKQVEGLRALEDEPDP